MNNQDESKSASDSLIPFIKYLLSKKVLLFLNFLMISILATLYVLYLVPLKYKSNIVFFPSMKFESAANPLQGLGLSISSSKGVDPYQIEEIFNTRSFKRAVIEEFNLIEKYELLDSKNKYELAQRELSEDLSLSLSEMGAFTVSSILSYNITAISTSPDTAFMMVEYSYNLLDSIITSIEEAPILEEASFLASIIAEKEKEFNDLKKEYNNFVLENKAYSLPKQLEIIVEQIGKLKSKETLNKLEIRKIRTYEAYNSVTVKKLENENYSIRKQISELEKGTSADLFPSLKKSPQLLETELEMKSAMEMYLEILKFLKQQEEEVSVALKKSTSGLRVVDPPVVPEYKYKPRRAVMIGVIVLGYMFLLIALLVMGKFYSYIKTKYFK